MLLKFFCKFCVSNNGAIPIRLDVTYFSCIPGNKQEYLVKELNGF